ncbi:hypothetical protein L249_1681 [Ophiocordyceps polyrhachis-furcata BCC 54312]|uniref:Uncharacterized protein n=1 Tax=Ophiocordyceps polyrhachis-furcata BCC 54312 TaxID=1330021 RepID=A0A367L039_9HYPO|nr:hypothetical protein L249_1681 [Ophiocordyceps polyrhachis-furcata BCC 54312]
MGKKWVCLLKSVGKVESNEVFCGAVEEEEGGEKLVEMEMMMSNQGVDYVIEKKKTNHVIVVLQISQQQSTTIEVGRYDRYWYSASIAYSAPIDVTAALCRDQSGAMTAIGTARRSLALWRALGLIGTICSKWPYRLISYPFKMKKYALYSS